MELKSEIFDRHKYVYSATVVSIYDGDTFTLDIDLGFGVIFRDQKVRLIGLDAPEVRGKSKEAGIKVRDHVRELIPDESQVLVRTIKDKKGKYGRFLAEIWFKTDGGIYRSLNQYLVDNHMAVDVRP